MIGGTLAQPSVPAIKANVFARPLLVVEEPEATALGAALLAGVAAGIYPSFDAAWRGLDRKEYVVEPRAGSGRALRPASPFRVRRVPEGAQANQP